ncbi:OLC1v1008299C3 [Oldenlandia corymbosa var. corymbosa]|uniref:OLC1v1008299C3 n=1 Tax=Oldenlandia corymbosa var. corymbosa TaxID=529605 RepID=A0AAV1DLK8_OLDCO|nr:OLC1v1008299C3 [Oldenlandia corymbosa var. corymbosa]
MANNSSSMMKHNQEPGFPVQQMSYQLNNNHHHQQQFNHHHHHQQQGGGGGGDVSGGGGSMSSPSIQQIQPPSSSSSSVVGYDGKGLVPGVLESSSEATATRFQPSLHGVSMDWTPEEQAILDEGLVQYANETNVVRYAKIAVSLKNKTVRDVALRYKWMMKNPTKRRKEDLNLSRKNKERKEKVTNNSATPSKAVMQPAIDDFTQELLRQNVQTFEQIHANLASFQIQNNIGLFCQARDNISQVLKRMHEPPYVMKQMPPLTVKVNEELANVIISQSSLALQ